MCLAGEIYGDNDLPPYVDIRETTKGRKEGRLTSVEYLLRHQSDRGLFYADTFVKYSAGRWGVIVAALLPS